MIIWNFFDRESLINGFESLYLIKREQLYDFLNSIKFSKNPTEDFLKTFSLAIDDISVDQVYLHCKHITTTIDDFSSFEKYGFLTLNELLKQDTSLRRFLNENGVYIDIDNSILNYCGKVLYIVNSDEECKECFYGSKCKHSKSIFGDKTTLEYRDMACDFRDNIKVLRSKIYNDKGEIEVHLFGSHDSIHQYSTVRYYPEILLTIERLINSLFDKPIDLTGGWSKLTNSKYYCLDFDVNINNFETITTGPWFDKEWYMQLLGYCKNDYSALDYANGNFFGNLFLICNGLYALLGNTCSLYGQIYPDVRISNKNVQRSEFSTDQD